MLTLARCAAGSSAAGGARPADRDRDDRSRWKRLLVAGVVLSAAATACGGGQRAPVTETHGSAGLPRSPCRGVDPWKGVALRRCAPLVSRWAPVRSVRLNTRPSPRVTSTCEQARRRTRISVVCPPLLPADGVVADRDLFGAEVKEAGDFYLLTFNNGDNVGHIHWIVGAGRGESVQRAQFNPRVWDVPGRIRRLGKRRYGPWAITFYRFPPHPSGGELGGHDLALAELRGTTYFASLHGRANHDADAAMLIAILLTAPVPR
jgi:hypothetical protein